MWKELVKKVEEIEQSFGEKLRNGATTETIETLLSRIEIQYGFTFSPTYKDFLAYVNGYDFNGYCIYGISEDEGDYLSMIVQNKLFHNNANLKRYWFYGTSDCSWYVYDFATQRYLETDASETTWNSYSSFDELLIKILTDSIG